MGKVLLEKGKGESLTPERRQVVMRLTKQGNQVTLAELRAQLEQRLGRRVVRLQG